MALSNQSDLSAFLSIRGKSIKKFLSIPILMTSRNRLSLADGFRLLVLSNPLLRFRLVVSQDLADVVKPSSKTLPFSVSHLPGIWPFSVSHLLGLG
jgi:hypothetical protein